MQSKITDSLEDLTASIKEYLELRIDEIKLNVAEGLALIISKFISTLILIFLGAIAVGYLSYAFGSWIGDLLNSAELGALITAGVIIILMIIVFLCRNRLFSDSLIRMFVKLFFNRDEKER